MSAAEEHPEGAPAEAEPVPITRYPNRRLYDRSRGRYVTLPEVAELVRQGKTVSVRDSKTGEDLTRSILMQIILEHHPERMALFPVAALHSMIGANEAALAVFQDAFRQSLAYLDLLRRSAAVNPFVLTMDWMRAFLPNAPPPGPPAGPAGAAPPAAADPAALADRVAELERRLEELQGSMGRGKPQPAPRRKKPPPPG
jgi:polyhydroxyalkanoate synthesis repressor PhaR